MLLLFQVLLIAASFSTSSLAEQDIWSPKCKASHSGQEYQGSEFVTQTGRRCKFWESLGADEKVAHNVSDAALPDGSLRKARNFCRNPSAAPDGPWCVTSDPSAVTDACAVPLCRVKDCRRTGPGVEFAGAATLENCKRWSGFPGSRFPEGSRAAAGRSCRNPDGDPGGPWCKVEKKGDARGYCHVPFCDERSACLTYTGNGSGAAPPDHYTRLPEAVEGNNVTLAVKLWDPARWAAAEVTVTLSRTVHAEGAADSLVLRVTGGGRVDLLSGVEEPAGGQASAEEGDGLPLLSGLRWATLWLAWEEDAVSVGVGGREEPLGTGRLTVRPLEDLKYYSVVGGGGEGLLWEPPFCGGNESCEEHVTSGAAEFSQFREMGDGQEAKVSVRAAGQWAAVELRVAPTLPVPRFRVTLGGDNVTTVSLKVDPSAPSTVLLRHRTESLLDYWKWCHLSVSVTREVLLVVWEDKGVTLAKVEHPQVANLRWFSVGSRQATAHWTLGCRLPDPPRAAPPECLLSASGDYSGSQWVTSRGLPCLPWTHPEAKEVGLGAAHVNYCRNPDGDRGGPWCYVVGVKGEVHRQSCRVRTCLNLECRMAGTANDYVGKVNTTRSGRRCRKWKKAEPEVDAALFPERSVVGARNFCRDPSRNVGGPWCWTEDPLVPRDLCHVPDCDEREECVALTRGSTEGRRVLMQPTWRTKGLAFALKEWDPDQRDSVEWHVWPPPDEGHHRHLRLDVAEEKVRLFLVTTEGGGGEEKELLLREKELAHLIPVGQWGRFRLAVAKGRLRLAYEGAEAALFEWQGGALGGAYFEPRHVGYASLLGRTVGVAFPCDACHTETTTTRLFTKILPVGLWRPPSPPNTSTPPSELTIHARGPDGATLRVALLQMPGLGDYHALTLGEGGDRVYWLRQAGGAVKVLKAVRLPFPLLRGDAWTRFRLRWTEDTFRLYVGDTLFLRERDPRPLLFYFFTVGAEGGAVTWTANCDPPDLDGPTVDGGWSEWQPSQCSASCGGGVGTRTRTCTSPPPSALGRDCEGDAAQEEVCNAFPCGVLSPDTLEILREERGRRAFALEAAPGAEVTMACGDALTMTRAMREAPDARLLWAADGRAVRGGNASRLTVRAARSAVYTCSLEGGGVPRRLLLRATALAVRAALTVRATTPLALDCEGLPLGLLYDHLEVRWELRGRLWRDYGVVVPAAVETLRVGGANESHRGVWRCLVEQRELGFLWLTNWVNVTVLPPPTFLTHLMEDPLPAKVFGRLANETQVLVALVCAASSFVALVVGLTVAYLRFCRLP